MRIRRWGCLLLTIAPLVAGCGDFWQPPSTTTNTCTSNCTTLSSGAFYVLNSATRQVAGYTISSGSLKAVSNSPYTLTAAPVAIAIAPSPGSFLFVSTAAPGIYLYSVGSGGALTLGNNSAPISQDPAAAMQVDARSQWLVDAFLTSTGVQLDAIPLTATGTYNGAKVQSISFSIAATAVHQLVISPDNANVFVTLGTSGTLVVPFNSSAPFQAGTQGRIVPLAGVAALSVAVDPGTSPRLFYIGETSVSATGGAGALRAFLYSSLNSSTLTPATGSPIASGGLAPNSILALASGSYVYVGNGQGTTSSGNIAGFSITSTGTTAAPAYTVAAVGTIATGVQPSGLAQDSAGNFVLAVSSGGSPDLEAYTMSAGTLTSALSATTGTDPVQAVAIAAAP